MQGKTATPDSFAIVPDPESFYCFDTIDLLIVWGLYEGLVRPATRFLLRFVSSQHASSESNKAGKTAPLTLAAPEVSVDGEPETAQVWSSAQATIVEVKPNRTHPKLQTASCISRIFDPLNECQWLQPSRMNTALVMQRCQKLTHMFHQFPRELSFREVYGFLTRDMQVDFAWGLTALETTWYDTSGVRHCRVFSDGDRVSMPFFSEPEPAVAVTEAFAEFHMMYSGFETGLEEEDAASESGTESTSTSSDNSSESSDSDSSSSSSIGSATASQAPGEASTAPAGHTASEAESEEDEEDEEEEKSASDVESTIIDLLGTDLDEAEADDEDFEDVEDENNDDDDDDSEEPDFLYGMDATAVCKAWVPNKDANLSLALPCVIRELIFRDAQLRGYIENTKDIVERFVLSIAYSDGTKTRLTLDWKGLVIEDETA